MGNSCKAYRASCVSLPGDGSGVCRVLAHGLCELSGAPLRSLAFKSSNMGN